MLFDIKKRQNDVLTFLPKNFFFYTNSKRSCLHFFIVGGTFLFSLKNSFSMKIRVRHFFPYRIFYFFFREIYPIEIVTETTRREKVAHIGQKKKCTKSRWTKFSTSRKITHFFIYPPKNNPFLQKCRQHLRKNFTLFFSRGPAYTTRFFKYCRQHLSRLFSKILKEKKLYLKKIYTLRNS